MSPSTPSTSDDDGRSNWRVISGGAESETDHTAELLNEAYATAPTDYTQNSTDQFLPRRATTARCRLCGRTLPLTKEHIPPRNVGNTQRNVSITLDQWLASSTARLAPGGNIQQGGIWGYTLCRDCNSYTGTHYGGEYRKWSQLATAVIDGLSIAPAVLASMHR